MQTGTVSIQGLMLQVSSGQLQLPEIQRKYVWKPAQIAGLIDSLYRGYPSGSLLMWKTSEEVTSRGLDSAVGSAPVSAGFLPTFLLDGQQRITSLHRVYSGHPRAEVVFHPGEEKFQVASAATRRDPRWVGVHGLLTGTLKTFALAQSIAEAVDHLDAEEIHERLDRVRRIGDYQYFYETLDDLSYPEVTQVFIRVNSRGRALKDTDLALATLSARWPGTVGRFDEQVEWCRQHGYDALDPAFLVRCLAAMAVDTTSPGGFATVPIDALERSWKTLERGLHHTLNLLQDEVQIDNSRLIPSINALVPIVYHLGTRPDAPLGEDERKALIYWLLVAFIESRYSSSAGTVLAQDVAALRSDEPLRTLLRTAGLATSRPTVTADRLAGKGSASPFFLLSYLTARREWARDWWFGLPIRLSHDGSYKVEFHHIHPQARLKAHYSKAEINDLANLAFISDRANKKISARSPEVYLADEAFDLGDLAAHCVPADPSVRSVEGYPLLLQGRRELLAAAMTTLLEHYRPSWLADVAARPALEPSSLSFQAVASAEPTDEVLLRYTATLGDATVVGELGAAELATAIADLDNGNGAELTIDGEATPIPAGSGMAIDLGPMTVEGSTAEWSAMLERELSEVELVTGEHDPTQTTSWEGQRVRFAVADSD